MMVAPHLVFPNINGKETGVHTGGLGTGYPLDDSVIPKLAAIDWFLKI